MRCVVWVAATLALSGLALASQKPGDGQVRIKTETDVLMLETAKTACEAQDFRGFFEAFVRSPFVRDAYSASTISRTVAGITTKVPRESYIGTEFPIALMDYYWVSAASARAVSADPKAPYEHLKMEFNQSQTDIWRVDWQRVTYDGKSEGGDDLGNVTGTSGAPGYVLFNPTTDCWQLTDDVVEAE